MLPPSALAAAPLSCATSASIPSVLITAERRAASRASVAASCTSRGSVCPGIERIHCIQKTAPNGRRSSAARADDAIELAPPARRLPRWRKLCIYSRISLSNLDPGSFQ
eukprot:scaffold117722_cov31-Tisochrysis_lutea.AAC.2